MKIIPTPPNPEKTPHAVITVSLSGRTYDMHWTWNERDRAWYWALASADVGMIVSGVRVVLGAVLNVGVPQALAPLYPIVVVDPTGKGLDPTLTTLGQNVKVVYTEPG